MNPFEERARTRKACTLALFLDSHDVSAEQADAMTLQEAAVVAKHAGVNPPSVLAWGEATSILRGYAEARARWEAAMIHAGQEAT